MSYEKALAELDTAAQEWSGWTGRMIPGTLWYNRAAIEYYRGNYDLVKEYIHKGQPLTWIDWGSPYYFLGKVYLREGNTDQAIQAFLWAEQTLDEGEFLNATRNELYNLGALPAGVPTPTSTPEQATTLGTPENTPIPTEVSGQIMQAYGTKDIYTRWINQDIEPTQVTVELAVSIQNTQKILSEEYGFDINELIQLQQDSLENVGKIFGP